MRVKEFKVVECSGTPYEIGLQIGKSCKDNIFKAMKMTFGALAYMNNTTKDSIVENAVKYLPKVQGFDPDLIDMIKGQADGAGIIFEEAFALKCGFDLMVYNNGLSGLCTSFAVTGKATAGGKTILGQNIDWVPGTPMDLLKITYPNGLVQFSLILWGIVEYVMNSEGFGMCANGTWANQEKFLFNIPISCYLPKAMRQRTVASAMEVLRQTARGLGYFHLASKAGEMLGIESVQDDYEIINPQADILVHSNHYLTDRFKKVDLVNILVPDSLQRVERFRNLINEHYGNITSEIMIEILADHDNYPNSICRHVDPTKPPQFHSETVNSFIMVPEDNVMYIAYGNPCEYKFIKYHLGVKNSRVSNVKF